MLIDHRSYLYELIEEQKNLIGVSGRLAAMDLGESGWLCCVKGITCRLKEIDKELQKWDRSYVVTKRI